MNALLIKDWQLNTPITRALLIVYATIPPLLFAVQASSDGVAHATMATEIASVFIVSATAGLCIALLFVAAYGSVAFGRERRDRSAEFLASMPVARSRVVVSKIVVTAALAVLPWMISGAYLFVAYLIEIWGSTAVPFSLRPGDTAEVVRWVVQIEIMLLGTSWLFSSLLRSEVAAAGVALLTGVLLFVAYFYYRTHLERTGAYGVDELYANRFATITMLTFGGVGMVSGTIIALRRVSP